MLWLAQLGGTKGNEGEKASMEWEKKPERWIWTTEPKE
jgi:hypothetical protein